MTSDGPTTQVTYAFVHLRPGSAHEIRELIAMLRAVPGCEKAAEGWERAFSEILEEDE